MTVETERLHIFPCGDAELKKLANICAENCALYKDAEKMMRGRERWELYTFWAAEHKSSSELVTEVRLKGLYPHGEIEIGYCTFDGYRGNGYATEAVGAICDYLSELPEIKFISALTAEYNTASHRVLEKNGFTHIGEKFGYMYWKKVI